MTSSSGARGLGQASIASGVVAALCGSMIFSINDTSIKLLSSDYPLHEVILIRSIIGLAFLLTLVRLREGSLSVLKTNRKGLHFLRMLVVLVSNVTYFLGIAAMPIADAVAIAFVAPVLITLLSTVVLKEKVGPHRIAAVFIGLAGTLVLMRPGQEAFSTAAILILLSAFCYAISQLMARSMRGTETIYRLSFYMQFGFLITSALVGLVIGDGKFAGSDNASLAFLFREWHVPALGDLPIFLASGMAVGVGGLLMAHAYRTLEAATVAPFEYAAIPMAILWGATIFGTYPDGIALLGMTMIVGSGLYTVWRETLKKKKIP